MNRYLLIFPFLLLMMTSCTNDAAKEFKTAPLIQNQMIIQQKQPAAFWGSATPGTEVTLKPSWGDAKTTSTDANGKWLTYITSPIAGGPHQLVLSTEDTSITISDIYSGEVWLASGQSNMEMPVRGWPPADTIKHSEEMIANAHFPQLRMFTVERNMAVSPQNNISGSWQKADSSNVGLFSAVAYSFALSLHKKRKVPVGIIHSSWGGSPAESWVSRSGLQSAGLFPEVLETLEASKKQIQMLEKWYDTLPQQSFSTDNDSIDWHRIDFEDSRAADPELDHSRWKTMDLPTNWEADTLTNFNGVVWYRKTIRVDSIGPEPYLNLGPVDDMDITYLNGKEIGSTLGSGLWQKERVYSIPEGLLKPGMNTLAVKVIDRQGGGGIYGDANDFYLDTGHNKVQLSGSWRYTPTAEYKNGIWYTLGIHPSRYYGKPRVDFEISPYSTPTVLYNGMIAPLIPYTIRGAVWYQGESNVGRHEQYETLFPTLIEDWRRKWNTEFPFYYVQIAPFDYATDDFSDEQAVDASPALRDAQRKTLSLSKTGMVVTLDVGKPDNIHPPDKQTVGERLARWALAKTYGHDTAYSGPLIQRAEIVQNKIHLRFKHADTGLVFKTDKNSSSKGFEIRGKNGFRPAEVAIEENKVLVWNEEITQPTAVRYAWRDTSTATLYNGDQLPASPFLIEVGEH